jgi:hypothetical protein
MIQANAGLYTDLSQKRGAAMPDIAHTVVYSLLSIPLNPVKDGPESCLFRAG